MKIQLYEHKTPEDAAMSAAAGVNFIGVTTGEWARLEAEVDFAACRAIFAAVPAACMKVALTVSWELAEIAATIESVQPDVIHLSGEIEKLPVARVAALRQRFPLVKIMQAIPVGGASSVALALAYQPVCDYIILDTALRGYTGIGATGATHDWSISAEIVRRLNLPVILAGGLSADNVGQAIRTVKPWCVDSFSHTNLTGTRRKDPVKVKAFVEAARGI
ncbi:MAG: phosphoribosylanthranilate isomerase [Caldilineaceae bacterium]